MPSRSACRGHFQAMPKPPVIKCHLIRITVEKLPNGRAVPGPLWLWRAGPGQPDLDLCARGYLHRFDVIKKVAWQDHLDVKTQDSGRVHPRGG